MAIFKIDNQPGSTIELAKLCSLSCGSLGERRVWERIDTCMCITESLHCSPETATVLLTGYTPTQNKKF